VLSIVCVRLHYLALFQFPVYLPVPGFPFALSLHGFDVCLDCLPGFDPCLFSCTCLWILLLIKSAFGSPLSLSHVQFHDTHTYKINKLCIKMVHGVDKVMIR